MLFFIVYLREGFTENKDIVYFDFVIIIFVYNFIFRVG